MRLDRYAFTLGVTLFLFLSGVLLGTLLDLGKYRAFETAVQEQTVTFESLQLQSFLLQQEAFANTSAYCESLRVALNESLKQLDPVLRRVLEYERNKGREETLEANILVRKYRIANTRYYLLARAGRDECGMDHAIILYFKTRDCPECERASIILTGLKERLQDRLLVFTYDPSVPRDAISRFMQAAYNITTFPTIILNEKPYQGELSTPALLREICASYETPPDACRSIIR